MPINCGSTAPCDAVTEQKCKVRKPVRGIRIALLGAALLMVAGPSQAPAYEHSPTKWVQLPDRLQNYSGEAAERWNRVGGPLLEWRVFSREGQVWAMTAKDFVSIADAGPSFPAEVDGFELTRYDTYARTEDGWLISFRRGEFGGALYWFSDDGRRHQRLGPMQVNQFLRVGDRFLAAEGLTHLAIQEGSLIEVYRAEGGAEWRYRTVKNTPSAAYAVARSDAGTLWMVLFDAIVSLDAAGDLKTLAELPWGARHANSIALTSDGGEIYVGERFWVIEVDVRTQELRFLVPPELLNQMESKSTAQHREWIIGNPPAVTLPAPDPSLQ